MSTDSTLEEPQDDDVRRLGRLLEPEAIAIIGASTDPSKRGYQAVRALKDANYRGEIYPVNPKGGEVLGVKMRRHIADLPFGVDVALIALPGHVVPSAIRELAARGVAGAVVLANGFREAGDHGAQLDAELSAAITETGIRVVGPNTSGIFNIALGADLVGLGGVPQGPVSVITQSGNMLLSLVADARAQKGPGFHSYIGLGNQADVRYGECMTFLAADDATGGIALHSEGLQDGRAFLVAAAAATRKCPVVMLRGGRSVVGQRTALSHTGSIAGSDAVASAVLAQAGVELVSRSDELSVVTAVLATTRAIADGRKVAILSDGGGHATLAVDALTAAGVDLAELSVETQTRLRELLGEHATVQNPIDVAGATDAQPSLFADCVDSLMRDLSVGLVLIVGLYGGYHLRFDPRLEPEEDSTANRLLEISKRHQVPLLIQSCYAADDVHNHGLLRAAGVQVLASIDHAIRAVSALSRRGHRLATSHSRSPLEMPKASPSAFDDLAVILEEPTARRFLEASGLSTGEWVLATSADELATAIENYGRPCAVKVVSRDVVHKSDVGGVVLNVRPDTAGEAWRTILDSIARALPEATLTGMIASPMVDAGVELLVGATRDPIFGPIVAFGSGGVLVEALSDVTFRAAPFTTLEAAEMIEETIASRLLDGYRQLPVVDRNQLAEFLVRVGDLVAAEPRIAELDLNPVIAGPHGIVPVDVRIVLTEPR